MSYNPGLSCSKSMLECKAVSNLAFCCITNRYGYSGRDSAASHQPRRLYKFDRFNHRIPNVCTVSRAPYHNKIFPMNYCKLSIRADEYNANKGDRQDFTGDEARLSKSQATDLILRLTEEERKYLFTALKEFESNQVKAEYEGQLAAARWRSKFGRPSKLPTIGDVDPTGSYCHLTDDWLKKKYAESVPNPTTRQLFNVAIFNAVPFIGFGFLDNFIMIVAGDYIDETVGSIVTISTMAAAALGNTISDVMGIGSAWYVELAASKVGLKAPNLSPIQLDMKPARRAANLGRACGIIIGCLLGMTPLLFLKKEDLKLSEQ